MKLSEHFELGDETDSEEARIRKAFRSIPLDRLREAGLLDSLLRLAGLDGADSQPVANGDAELIDTLDPESLVQMALENPSS
jgi:pimaricinolide synthase PimS1